MSSRQHSSEPVAAIRATTFAAIGTSASVLATDDRALGVAEAITRDHLAELDRTASRFRDDSEIERLRSSGGRPIEISALLTELIGEALWAATVTDGLLNPTVGHALELCGYDRDFHRVAPTGPGIELACRRVPGWQGITLDLDDHTVTVPRGVVLDLGATAKASCADRAATAAAGATGTGVLVNIGGDIAVAGPAPLGGWPVTIADRHDAPPDAPGPRVSIHTGGLASSGTAARRWQRGGHLLHHVIDPSTGLPATPSWRTVSVTADTCLAANVAATAAIILGPDAPAWLAVRGFHARLKSEDGPVVRVGQWPPDNDGDDQNVEALGAVA